MRTIIVGGGIIGCSTAYYLSQMDPLHEILLIERHEVAGSSSGKAGGFLALDWCDDRLSGPLSRKSFELHGSLGQAMDVDHRPLNTISLQISSEEDSKRRGLTWMKGVRVESLGTTSTTAQVHPRKLTRALLDGAFRLGNLALLHKTVTGVDLEGSRVKGVFCGEELISGDAVVFAMGPWSNALKSWLPRAKYLKKFGGGTRCHSILMEAPQETGIDNTAVFAELYSKELEFYPRPDGTLYVCGEDDTEPLPDDPSRVLPDSSKINSLQSLTKTSIPSLSKSGLKASSACYIPSSPDSEPIIGPLEEYEGIYMGAGFTVWGILNGPGAGMSLAELVLGKKVQELSIPECKELFPRRFLDT